MKALLAGWTAKLCSIFPNLYVKRFTEKNINSQLLLIDDFSNKKNMLLDKLEIKAPNVNATFISPDNSPRELTPELEDFINHAINNNLNAQLRKQINAQRIAYEAGNIIAEENPPVPKEEPSKTWINKFMSEAENIEEEHLRDMFSRLLAGELKEPGSFSLRTVDILSKMSIREAKDFANTAQYALYTPFASKYFLLTNCSLYSFDQISQLTDLGLYNYDASVNFWIDTKNKQKACLFHGGKVVIFTPHREASRVTFRNITLLTKPGRDLFKFVEKKYSKEILKNFPIDPKCQIDSYEFKYISDEQLRYAEIPFDTINPISKQNN